MLAEEDFPSGQRWPSQYGGMQENQFWLQALCHVFVLKHVEQEDSYQAFVCFYEDFLHNKLYQHCGRWSKTWPGFLISVCLILKWVNSSVEGWRCGKKVRFITLNIYYCWQGAVERATIKEAIIRAQRRMLYFNQVVFRMRTRNMCFCSPSSSLGHSKE